MSDENAPTLFLLGATHYTAPIELREKLALAGRKLASASFSATRSERLVGWPEEKRVGASCHIISWWLPPARPEQQDGGWH